MRRKKADLKHLRVELRMLKKQNWRYMHACKVVVSNLLNFQIENGVLPSPEMIMAVSEAQRALDYAGVSSPAIDASQVQNHQGDTNENKGT